MYMYKYDKNMKDKENHRTYPCKGWVLSRCVPSILPEGQDSRNKFAQSKLLNHVILLDSRIKCSQANKFGLSRAQGEHGGKPVELSCSLLL
ncbi:uncharacterized protein G2W53_008045 [Senna tora]|uniref:Uncharacterized protein n=1 Tax=Senna tora TaxID=362788 RepID=A0A834X9C4_9FABA|nr:uncharacterized protein G2W53_008045 [Senna tora]